MLRMLPIPSGYKEGNFSTSAAGGLDSGLLAALPPDDVCLVRIIIGSYPVAWRVDGGTPTSATLQQVAAGAVIYLHSAQEAQAFQAIGLGGTATYAAQAYKRY